MSIRIDHTYSGSETVVHIAGHLAGVAVQEFQDMCDSFEEPFVVDLSSLLFADDEGINALRAIIDRGAQVLGASPFVELLLDHAEQENSGGKNQNHYTWD